MKKRNYFTKYGPEARAVLEALLKKYADSGLADLESPRVLQLDPFAAMGTPVQLVKAFGGPDAYAKAKKNITYLVIGIFLIVSALVLVRVVSGIFNPAV